MEVVPDTIYLAPNKKASNACVLYMKPGGSRIKLDNGLMTGHRIITNSCGSGSIVDVRGFEIKLPANELQTIISKCEISHGVIITPCSWGCTITGTHFTLIPEQECVFGSQLYLDLSSSVPRRNIRAGNQLLTKSNKIVTYWGEIAGVGISWQRGMQSDQYDWYQYTSERLFLYDESGVYFTRNNPIPIAKILKDSLSTIPPEDVANSHLAEAVFVPYGAHGDMLHIAYHPVTWEEVNYRYQQVKHIGNKVPTAWYHNNIIKCVNKQTNETCSVRYNNNDYDHLYYYICRGYEYLPQRKLFGVSTTPINGGFKIDCNKLTPHLFVATWTKP